MSLAPLASYGSCVFALTLAKLEISSRLQKVIEGWVNAQIGHSKAVRTPKTASSLRLLVTDLSNGDWADI